MPLMKCPKCTADVLDSAPCCPHCGYPLRSPKAKYVIIAASLVLAIAAGVWFWRTRWRLPIRRPGSVAATDGPKAPASETLNYHVVNTVTYKGNGRFRCQSEGVLGVENLLVCDGELESAVVRTLSRSPRTKGERIFARSSLGVVSLEGRVDSA